LENKGELDLRAFLAETLLCNQASLQHLELCNCEGLSTELVQEIAAVLPRLSSLKKLETARHCFGTTC
jgi:hypothetical protein